MGLFGENDYEDVYENIRDSGFVFVYNNRHLSKSKIIGPKDVCRIPISKRNDDEMLVKCRPCDVYMDFIKGTSEVLSGRWTCPRCGVTVRERSAYMQLSRENAVSRIDSDFDE